MITVLALSFQSPAHPQSAETATGPLRVWPVNPHYLMFKGKQIVLITSDHHYGAIIDRDFNFTNYLAFLGRAGMNLTRIYPGGMFEPPDKFLRGNPLGPRPGRQVLPWVRSDQPGAHAQLAEAGRPSYKFDLDRWDPGYFERLRAFVEMAEKLGIVVEVAFFNGMYKDCWPLMPFYHGNNIQGVGNYEAENCQLFTTDDPRNAEVLARQAAYVRKITVELNRFDNVIYDICDEPTIFGVPEKAARRWIAALKDAFLEAERPLAKKHLLGQTVQSLSPDFSAEAWCQWLPTEYVVPAQAAFERNYAANKPILNVESDYYGYGLTRPYTVEDVRAEGWWFMVGGGAGFIGLNGEYHRGRESGGLDTTNRIVPEKKVLQEFIASLDLAGLRRFTNFSALPPGTFASASAEPGKQYAVYFFHGRSDGKWGAHFVVATNAAADKFVLRDVPAGEYMLEWVHPPTGATRDSETRTHSGGDFASQTPAFTSDIALRMKRSREPAR